MTMSRSTVHVATSAIACGFVLWASPAQAAAYYSSSNPLKAWEDGTAQALGHGYMSVYQSSHLRNHTYTKDPRPGGDPAFHTTEYNIEVRNWDSTTTWQGWKHEDQSVRTDSGRWRDEYDYQDYTIWDSVTGRIRAKVCEDQANSPDPCSTRPVQTFGL